MMHVSKVRESGGSLTTSIPRSLCRTLGIGRGDLLLITYTEEGVIRLRRLDAKEYEQLKKNAAENAGQTP